MGFDEGSQKAPLRFCEATTLLESHGQNCKQLELIPHIHLLSWTNTLSVCINYAVSVFPSQPLIDFIINRKEYHEIFHDA